MENIPENHKHYWTTEEDQSLYIEILNKKSIDIIAKNHKRTINAIKCRLIKNAISDINRWQKEYSFNPPINHLMKITNLSKEEILEGLKKNKIDYNDYNDINYQLENINYNLKQIWSCLFILTIFEFFNNFFNNITNNLIP